MKTGLLGGTFDPVHEGHVQVARTALEEGGLDRVVMIPAAGPPHKGNTSITPFQHRLAMVRLAVRGIPGVEISDIEGKLPKPSFTIDTIKKIIGKSGPLEDFYFILGVDAFLELPSWKSWRELLALIPFLVASRQGFTDHEGLRCTQEQIGYGGGPDRWHSLRGDGKNIIFLKKQISRVSSSELREYFHRSGSGSPVGLSPEVVQYIRKNCLYS